MIGRRPSSGGEPEPIRDRRTRDRLQKRAKRAKLAEQGLTATGQPLKHPHLSTRHPEGCPCYDCLWGDR